MSSAAATEPKTAWVLTVTHTPGNADAWITDVKIYKTRQEAVDDAVARITEQGKSDGAGGPPTGSASWVKRSVKWLHRQVAENKGGSCQNAIVAGVMDEVYIDWVNYHIVAVETNAFL